MGLRALLKNLTKLVLMGLGVVLGVLIVIWSRSNADWVVIRFPDIMSLGSSEDIEYEARLYGIVALSFSAGVLSCLWFALAIWIRAVRRERRLAKVLEDVEAQVAETQKLHFAPEQSIKSLPSPGENSANFEDFDEIDEDNETRLISDTSRLPEGYDELGDTDTGLTKTKKQVTRESGGG